jgi:hypothetical protein
VIERARAWADLGERQLSARAVDAACGLVEAVSLALTFPAGRVGHLEAADWAVVRLRVLLRLAQELGYLSPGGLRFSSARLQAAGKMIGGWRKRMEPLDIEPIDLHGGQGFSADQTPGDGPPAAAGA